jgi:hypothetical protein
VRATLACFTALALSVSACQCGAKLSIVTPGLTITQPTTRLENDWVIDFGSVSARTTNTAPIVIENRGKLVGTITKAALREGSDPAFTLSETPLPAGLQVAESRSLTVTYAPSKAGPATGYVDIETDDPKLPTATVRLLGAAQSSQVQVCIEDPSVGDWDCGKGELLSLVMDFGLLKVGATPITRKVQVRNIGTLDLQYLGTALAAGTPPQFSITPLQVLPAGGTNLSPSTNAEFSIQFSPTVAGNFAGTAVVTTTDAMTPTVNIALKAGAAASLICHLTVTPAHVDFGSVPNSTTADQTILAVNDGMLPCSLKGLTLGGSAAFTLVGAPALPKNIVTNGVFTVVVHYAPSGTTTDNGTLTVTSDDPVAPTVVIPLKGTSIAEPACQLVATPASLAFGGLAPGDQSIRAVKLAPIGSELCTITGATIRNGTPAFTAPANYPIMVMPGGMFGNATIGVRYAPTVNGTHLDTLDIFYTAGMMGPTLKLSVPLSGRAGPRQLCVVPTHLHFGAVGVGATKDLSFTMSACGTAAVSVLNMIIEPAGTPFALQPVPAYPITLAPITPPATKVQVIRVSPTNPLPVAARVHIVSQDPVFPDQYVDLDTGPELVPADAGEVLYSWTAGAFGGGAMDGTVYKTMLQGPPNRTAFYGTQSNQSCAGCHAASPDGRYVALVEYGTAAAMKIVDAKTGGSVPVPGTSGGLFPSWRPNVNTTPAYQFVYSDGNILKIASISGGIMGPVQGANDPAKVQTHPTWGPNGQIAFVRGNPDADAGTFEITGPSDLLLIPEDGGTAVPVAGASNNGGGNYYPEFSPNGKYLAYTFSPAGKTSRSAPDSVIKLVAAANTGAVLNLPLLNAAGPNSWPTWSRDGMYLSFSSTRSGGHGSADIYYAPVNQNTGVDGAAVNLNIVSTSSFDHIARWAMLPP